MNLPANNQGAYRLALKDGSYFDVDSEMVDFYQTAYPAIDVHGELRLMVAWCFSNDAKRKTRRGIKRFINSWLNGAKAKAATSQTMSQRDYAKQTTIQERITNLDWADGLY